MNVKALRAFRATLAGGTLAKAAEAINLSQPAVSRLISALEGELRLTLFDRSGRNLTPTDEGLSFYLEAGRILNNLDEIPNIAADIRAGKAETLRIVTMPRVAHAFTVPAVAQFLGTSPTTNVMLDVQTRREASKWLAGKQYDLGIGALPVDHPEISTEVLFQMRAQAVVPRDHSLSSKSTIDADDLKDCPIIRLMRGLLLREQADDFFGAAGITARQYIEVASSQMACSLAECGVGITVADELVATQCSSDRVSVIPLEPERWMSFGVLMPRKTRPKADVEKFMRILKEKAEDLARSSTTIRLA
ncbi:MAG: LysR family transcriptional regulator [Pseudomonadota bacterium]